VTTPDSQNPPAHIPHHKRPLLSKQATSFGIAATVVIHILIAIVLIKGMVGGKLDQDKKPRKIPVAIQLPPPPPPPPQPSLLSPSPTSWCKPLSLLRPRCQPRC